MTVCGNSLLHRGNAGKVNLRSNNRALLTDFNKSHKAQKCGALSKCGQNIDRILLDIAINELTLTVEQNRAKPCRILLAFKRLLPDFNLCSTNQEHKNRAKSIKMDKV